MFDGFNTIPCMFSYPTPTLPKVGSSQDTVLLALLGLQRKS